MATAAFLSYAHLDDAGATNELSLFHDRLQHELRIQTGLPVQIFFDRKAIGWGKRWSELIESSVQEAVFFVPILTPAFFQSNWCKQEYIKFADAEAKSGRRDLILPIYYVKSREMNFKSGEDSLVDDILSRQYRDWRDLRHKPRDSVEVLREFAELAAAMAETFFDIHESRKLTPVAKSRKEETDLLVIKEAASLLDREMNYENLVLYSVAEYPDMPVSQGWLNALIKDVNKQRYRTVRDIDREVKFANPKVKEYARERPELFKFSTDYITKSLIFVDSEFRETHSISPVTRAAAERAGITRY